MSAQTDLTKLTPEELIKLIQEKDADLQASENYISELKEDLEKKDSEVSTIGGTPIVKSGKDTYLIAIPSFTYKGSKYTVSDLLSDEKLVAELVKMQSGVLVKA